MKTDEILTLLEKGLPTGVNAEITMLEDCRRDLELNKNAIGQASQVNNLLIQVKVERAGHVGISTLNSLTASGLARAVVQARDNAKYGPQRSLVLTGSIGHRDMDLVYEATARHRPADWEKIMEPVFTVARQANLKLRGLLRTHLGRFFIVNTDGLKASTPASFAMFRGAVSSVDGTGRGHGYSCHRDINQLNIMDCFLEAAAKCMASDKPRPLSAGHYTVILEPAAVADLMALLVKLLGGRAYARKATPIKLGERIFGENISIWDDGLDAAGLPIPFDFQGVPKQRLNLVTKGVVQNITLDNETANSLDMVSSGHAVQPGSHTGPIAIHVFLEPQNAMLDDMIASTKNGILVSRLRDLTMMDASTGFFSGGTGDGTLLIKDGRLSAALPNLRFIHNLVEILNQTEMIGDETRLFGNLWGGTSVPALKIHGFPMLGSSVGKV